MANYITTNVRFPEEDYLRLKEEAARKRASFSAVIREKVGAKKKASQETYLKKLLSLKTDWFTEKDYQDYEKIRKEWDKRLKRYNW